MSPSSQFPTSSDSSKMPLGSITGSENVTSGELRVKNVEFNEFIEFSPEERCYVIFHFYFAPTLVTSISKLHSETSVPSLVVLPSAPVLLTTAPSRTPARLSVCHKKPVRYCSCGELCSHVAYETHWLEPLVNTPAVMGLKETLWPLFPKCLVCVFVCVHHCWTEGNSC